MYSTIHVYMITTEKQQRVLEYIRSFNQKNGALPSLRQMAKAFGVSLRAIQIHVDALKKKGLLFAQEQQVRSYHLSPVPMSLVGGALLIPLLGSISAGLPTSEEVSTEFFELSPQYFGAFPSRYALKVVGDSMSGDHICDGDVAIIGKVESANKKDIYAVKIDNTEFTLKRLVVSKTEIKTIPSNPLFPVLSYTPDRVEIIGKLIGLVRKP